MTSPRSLLVGATGQVGTQMLHLLGRERALPTARYPPAAGWLPLDLALLDAQSQAATLLDAHPLEAIYCIAGMTNVEACEDQAELAHRTNARGPSVLASYARTRGIPFVYFSTEYIFDGRSGPYSEDDQPNPINVYGHSKLAGEKGVLDANPDALILRTTVVYGPDDRQKNYLYSLMSAIAARRVIKVPEDQISTPTYNQDLVRTAVALVSTGAHGVFHVCGPELLSRLRFAQAVTRHLGLDTRLLQAIPTSVLGQRAARPLSAGLLTHKLAGSRPTLRLRSVQESIADCAPQLRSYFLQQQTLLSTGG